MGLAKLMNGPKDLTSTFAGTPLMMAPELLRGDKYNQKVDVWSLGALLYQILTDEYPFKATSLQGL